MIMLTTLGLGILTSHLTEVVVALNKRLQGTLLQGDGAFLLAGGMALIASLVKVFYIDGTPLPAFADYATWKAIAPTFAEVWTVMQVYFLYVVQNLGLSVKQSTVVNAPATGTALNGSTTYSAPSATGSGV